MSFKIYAATCPNRIEIGVEPRPVNGLNIEVGTPAPRCTMQPPEHWGDASVLRWLGSGGSALVLGRCGPSACEKILKSGDELPKR